MSLPHVDVKALFVEKMFAANGTWQEIADTVRVQMTG